MENEDLYIIGNGFDIYHGLESRYSNFKEYLRVCDPVLHDNVVKFLPVKENWCDLELAFAYLDIDQVIDEASEFLHSYSAENWSDSFHHDYQFELDRIVTALSRGLKSHFYQWIRQLNLSLTNQHPNKIVRIPPSSTFLNFNYTRTLQCVYGVKDTHIMHIHGEADQDESSIILGHSWNPKDIPDLNDVPNPEDMDTRVMEGNERINSYFGDTFKPSSEIIESRYDFFSGLKKIRNVYVLGHSLSEVDLPYFEEIIEHIDIDSNWYVTYYGEEEFIRHGETLSGLGVGNFELCSFTDLE